MEQNLLTEPQKKILGLVFAEPKLSGFYLTGGTALAQYYLKHRISDDLDLFTKEDPDLSFIHAFVEKAKREVGSKEVRFSRLYDRNQFFFVLDDGELKIEFTKYPFQQLLPTNIVDNLKIDSLRDISANKLMAMLDRFDPKDFADLFFILQSHKLESIVLDAEKKFEIKIDIIFLGSELLKVRRVAALPKMIKALEVNELKNFFEDLALTLAPKVIE